jgi:hypothetical protein
MLKHTNLYQSSYGETVLQISTGNRFNMSQQFNIPEHIIKRRLFPQKTLIKVEELPIPTDE